METWIYSCCFFYIFTASGWKLSVHQTDVDASRLHGAHVFSLQLQPQHHSLPLTDKVLKPQVWTVCVFVGQRLSVGTIFSSLLTTCCSSVAPQHQTHWAQTKFSCSAAAAHSVPADTVTTRSTRLYTGYSWGWDEKWFYGLVGVE